MTINISSFPQTSLITSHDLKAMSAAFSQVEKKLTNEQKAILAKSCTGENAALFADNINRLSALTH